MPRKRQTPGPGFPTPSAPVNKKQHVEEASPDRKPKTEAATRVSDKPQPLMARLAAKGEALLQEVLALPVVQKGMQAMQPYKESAASTVGHFVTEYRGIFVVLFLLPISFLADCYFALSHWYMLYGRRAATPKSHSVRVERVRRQIKDARAQGVTKMCTARPPVFAMSFREGLYKSQWAKIDLNDFNHVLDVNPSKRTVRVEPLVSMGQITSTLIPKGWTLAVTPELDDLTVGGLIMGFGIETSSHRFGLFQHIVKAMEVVLPNGEWKRCSPEENTDLFYALPWSHGTLGFLVAAEVEIIPCQALVELTYRPCFSQEQYVDLFAQASDDPKGQYDFVESLVFSKDTAVVMTGKMASYKDMLKKFPMRWNPIGFWYKPWFYQHVQSYLKKPSLPTNGVKEGSENLPMEYTEYIPLRHYYHRHTRSIFWELKDIIPFADHWMFRFLLGWMTPPRISIIKYFQTDAIREAYGTKHVAQDMLVPMRNLSESLDCMDTEFNCYPLWLCPMLLPGIAKNSPGAKALVHPKPALDLPFTESMIPGEMFVDIGAYGAPKDIPNFQAQPALRNVERFVLEKQGYQALYADSYLSRDEFKQMFDHRLYDEVRQKYELDATFPEIYDKVSMSFRK